MPSYGRIAAVMHINTPSFTHDVDLESSMRKRFHLGLILLTLPLALTGCYAGPYHHHHRDDYYRHGRHDHGYYNDYRGRPPGWR